MPNPHVNASTSHLQKQKSQIVAFYNIQGSGDSLNYLAFDNRMVSQEDKKYISIM